MSQQSCSKSQVERVRLASYLTLGVTGAMMATAHSEAAVMNIDIANLPGSSADISGANAGVASGGNLQISDWLGVGTGNLNLYNGLNGYHGLDGGSFLQFAINGGNASPRNFAYGDSIDSSATWSQSLQLTAFRYDATTASSDFGANSFMGFRFSGDSGANWKYGYLEVTWNAVSNTFEILSGACESTTNMGILAGATPSPSAVPGGGVSAMALMALGGGAFRRRSRNRVA
jgi:hypothetical protein